MKIIELGTSRRSELVDITDRLQGVVKATGIQEGIVLVQSLHTIGGLTINENADPDVQHDLIAKLDRLAPQNEQFYRHSEGNSDSHLKASLFGPSLSIIVSSGRLVLGTWQGVYFCEWDGPRERRIGVMVVSA